MALGPVPLSEVAGPRCFQSQVYLMAQLTRSEDVTAPWGGTASTIATVGLVAFAPRTPGCFDHHLVWFDGEPLVKIGCAHCTYVSRELDLSSTYTDQEISRAIESSRASHARLCNRGAKRRPAPTRRR